MVIYQKGNQELSNWGIKDPITPRKKKMTDWKEAKLGDVVKLEAGDRIEGKFIELEQSKLYPDSYALKVETLDGIKVVFVSTIVKGLLESNSIMKNQEIAVLYKGLKKNEAGTRDYKDYSLFFK